MCTQVALKILYLPPKKKKVYAVTKHSTTFCDSSEIKTLANKVVLGRRSLVGGSMVAPMLAQPASSRAQVIYRNPNINEVLVNVEFPDRFPFGPDAFERYDE
eukprot:CAMPEP_0196590126 /NCGR_PEP_ID=MMETSP1081-20130531/65659_1 /TAXON_ID=36882 /ORGANISM="Pyramimonas amylifera, Strain CCMP720" /LENGTH=101 /DNA_ID=CAMNT_0041913129 /DNA_START=59 /DNA_END=361 /DNA_ORIENTATION=-